MTNGAVEEFLAPADHTADSVWQKADALYQADSVRRARYSALALRYFQDAYLNSGAEALLSTLGITPDKIDVPTFAVGRAHVDAAVAKIAGVNKPRVQFMATQSDWRLRRTIDSLEQFCLGTFSSPCEQFASVWDLRKQTWRDACMLGDEVVRVYFDESLGRATYGRCLPWEILFDPDDAFTGHPTCMWYRYAVDTASLVADFPEDKKGIIASPNPSVDDRLLLPGAYPIDIGSLSRQVRITEFWQRKIGKDPGRHMMVTHNGTILIDEDWNHPWFPFEMAHWTNPLVGMWGASLIEQSKKIERWINRVVRRIVEATEKTSSNIVIAAQGTLTDKNSAFCRDNSVLEWNGQTGKQPPQVVTPQAFNPQLFETVREFWSRSFELVGVNQMSATAQKQPGIEANSAIRTMADLQSERFGVQAAAFQDGFVGLARKGILITRDNIGTRKVSVNVPGDRFLNSVQWKGADIDEESFYVQAQPAPTSRWTLAGRIQAAEQLGEAGQLSPESVLRVQRYGDLPDELNLLSKQDEYIGRMIDRWMDSTPAQRASNLVRPGDDASPQLVPVIERVLDIPRAILIAGPAYMEAIFDEVDPEILELFAKWFALVDEEVARQQPQQPPQGQQQPPQPNAPQQPPQPQPQPQQ